MIFNIPVEIEDNCLTCNTPIQIKEVEKNFYVAECLRHKFFFEGFIRRYPGSVKRNA